MWFAALIFASVSTEPGLALSYSPRPAAELEKLPLGSKVSIDALIFLAGGGYWFVLRSPRCGERGIVRVVSGIGPRTRASVFKAAGQTNDHQLFAARADISATMTLGIGPDTGRRGLSITSVKRLRVVRCDCIRDDPAFR
jgi:hypothetical protein